MPTYDTGWFKNDRNADTQFLIFHFISKSDTRHTGRFLSLWMLLLPTAMYDAFADKTAIAVSLGNFQCLPLIPATAVVGLFLFGIEELAMQLEEPFSILPMQKFCDDVRRSTSTISEWSLGDKSGDKDLL